MNKKKNKKNKEQTTFDPKTMTKTPGGHGFGMKRGYKPTKEEMSGRKKIYQIILLLCKKALMIK